MLSLSNLSIKDSSKPAKLKEEFKLYDYQRKVVKWMRQKESCRIDGISGGLICLIMGLGKTLIALYHTFRTREKISETFPTLVVLSKTLLYEWKNEGVDKFFNDVNVLYFHKDFIGNKAMKNMSTSEIKEYDIVFTTYDVCLTIYKTFNYEDSICQKGNYGIHKDKVILIKCRSKPRDREVCGMNSLYEIPWKRIFCDESQRFANPSTQTFKAVMALYSEHRWCLTGTPIKNYDTDIWAQLRFCGFDKVVNARQWKRHCYKMYNCEYHIYKLNYSEANVTMPDKKDIVYKIHMDKHQTKVYETVLEKLANIFEKFLSERKISYACVLAMFTRLRQICIAPNLLVASKTSNKDVQTFFEKVAKEHENPKWLTNRLGTSGIKSPKVQKTVEIAKKVINGGEKIIVFSMFVTALELVETALEKEKIPCVMMIGKTGVKERLECMQTFKENKTCNVMLIHYKVGGEGINLTEATHVIPLEPWWTHAVHNQGIHRSWRRGQTKPVTVHWLLTCKKTEGKEDETIEDRVLNLCKNKMNMVNSYLHGFIEYNEKTGIDIYGMRKVIFGR